MVKLGREGRESKMGYVQPERTEWSRTVWQDGLAVLEESGIERKERRVKCKR
jgi:hypothetical protein